MTTLTPAQASYLRSINPDIDTDQTTLEQADDFIARHTAHVLTPESGPMEFGPEFHTDDPALAIGVELTYLDIIDRLNGVEMGWAMRKGDDGTLHALMEYQRGIQTKRDTLLAVAATLKIKPLTHPRLAAAMDSAREAGHTDWPAVGAHSFVAQTHNTN